MSGLVNKVKDALHSDKSTTHHDTTTSTTGHHTTTGATGTTGTHGTTTGQNIAAHREGPAPNTAGPHKSDALNKADPRIDSDKDYSRNMGANPDRSATTGTHHTTGTHTTGTHTTGTHHTAGTTTGRSAGLGSAGTTGYSENIPEGTYGQHNSRLANAADPRIDSDLDGSRARGTGTHTGSGLTSGTTTGHTTTTHGSSGLGSSGAPEGTYGHHNSRAANAADPRIDSDRDGSRNLGSSTHTHNTRSTGTTGTSGLSSGTTAGLGGTHATGPAPNTAGPHKSDALNKADPRVDSDLDGSKTYGGNKTFQQSTGSAYAGRDPTDATQVPPSVMQKHLGAPEQAHDDHTHEREKRHSVSHQEQHRGL